MERKFKTVMLNNCTNVNKTDVLYSNTETLKYNIR